MFLHNMYTPIIVLHVGYYVMYNIANKLCTCCNVIIYKIDFLGTVGVWSTVKEICSTNGNKCIYAYTAHVPGPCFVVRSF